MTGFEEEMNREVWRRGRLIAMEGKRSRWTAITPGHFLFFHVVLYLCFL